MQVTTTIIGEVNPVKVVHVHHDGGKVYITYIDSTLILKSRELARGDGGVTSLGTGAVNVP